MRVVFLFSEANEAVEVIEASDDIRSVEVIEATEGFKTPQILKINNIMARIPLFIRVFLKMFFSIDTWNFSEISELRL